MKHEAPATLSGLSGQFRDELLNAELFTNLEEARVLSEWWKSEYNHRRPHSSPGYRAPAASHRLDFIPGRA